MTTTAQIQTLEAIDTFIQQHGHSPSYENLADERGLASKSGVERLVRALKAQGLVNYRPNCARTLCITDEGVEALLVYRRAMGRIELSERIARVMRWASDELTAPPNVRDDAQTVLKTLADQGVA